MLMLNNDVLLLLLIQQEYHFSVILRVRQTLSCQNTRYISVRAKKHEPHLALFSTARRVKYFRDVI